MEVHVCYGMSSFEGTREAVSPSKNPNNASQQKIEDILRRYNLCFVKQERN